MPEHDCGGWCESEKMRATVEWARKGLSVRKVAECLSVPSSTVAERLAKARRMGCLPEKTTARGPAVVRIEVVCWCGNPVVAKRKGTAYCSDKCATAARRAGIRVNEKHTGDLLGPPHPEVVADEVGIRRRFLDAVEAGVDYRGLRERFGQWVPEATIDAEIARAKAAGKRDTSMPLGIPA